MYEKFYGLSEKPFSLLPDPEYLYLSRHHQRALTLLEYGILNQAGFCVISGKAGAGKTTLIRYLLNRFEEDTTIGLLSNTHESFEELLAWILMSFDLPHQGKTKTELYQSFVDFLIEQYAQKRHTVLIIDEAQNMSPATLEELRMLSNINADKDQLLQMILMGQPGLLKNLQRPELRQFAQRIAVDYKLEAMNKDETCTYIRHRLKIAGREADIFDEGACKAIYYHSRGLPRLINLLCDTALVYGYAENAQVIDKRIINDVVKERDSNTILPRYHELNEETDERSEDLELAEETEPVLTDPVEEQAEQIVLESKITSCGEKAEFDKPASVTEIAAIADEDVAPGSANVSPLQTASVTPLKQAEHFSKAIDMGKSSDHDTAPDKMDTKIDERNREMSNVISVNSQLHDDSTAEPGIEHKAGTGSTHSGSENKLEPPVQMASTIKSGNMGFIILGFAFGLLMSVAVLILYKMDTVTTPVVDEAEISGRMKEIEKEFAHKLRAIQQQREIDLEKNRIIMQEKEASRAQAAALQRERDAALAIARAREELLQAKLRAEQAKKKEQQAQEKASLALERAHAAELEAKKIQQRKIEAALAAEKARQEAMTAKPVEETVSEAFPEDATVDTLVVETPPTVEEQEALSKKTRESGFSANPCDGPKAVFMSTCKK